MAHRLNEPLQLCLDLMSCINDHWLELRIRDWLCLLRDPSICFSQKAATLRLNRICALNLVIQKSTWRHVCPEDDILFRPIAQWWSHWKLNQRSGILAASVQWHPRGSAQ